MGLPGQFERSESSDDHQESGGGQPRNRVLIGVMRIFLYTHCVIALSIILWSLSEMGCLDGVSHFFSTTQFVTAIVARHQQVLQYR